MMHGNTKLKYILPISTVRIRLHVSVLYVDHLQVEIFNLQISYTTCVGRLCERGEGERDFVVYWLKFFSIANIIAC